MSVFTEDLFEEAKNRSFAPISQQTFTTEKLKTIANAELSLKLVKDIFGVREDFFEATKDVALPAGTARVAIPKRAIASTFRSIWYVSGGEIQHELDRGDDSDFSRYAGQTGTPERFVLVGDEVYLLPRPADSNGSIRFFYYARPNKLIETSSCAKITGITTVGDTTTLDVDTDLTESLEVGDEIDFLASTSPFMLWAEEVEVLAISSTQIQVAKADIVDEVSTVEPRVDDYICPTGYSNIPMVPIEFHPVLAQMVAARMLAALGMNDKLALAKGELKELRDEAKGLIKNRVESKPKLLKSGRRGLIAAFSK
jgi:hypothetical protein